MSIADEAAKKPSPSRFSIDLPKFELPEELPTDVASLHALMRAQQAAMHAVITRANEHVTNLYEQVALMRHRMFGASSERMTADETLQSLLFAEAEELATNGDGRRHCREVQGR